jgi:Spy/CpxP family protein refolding chaperone
VSNFSTGLRGLSAKEIGELRAGTGMGLARAAELNGYPGPRHVLDAIESGQLPATSDQATQIRAIFDKMQHDAQRVGGEIIAEEQRLEAAFHSSTIDDTKLGQRVARIATLQGELRRIHLSAHVATRAILSEAQVNRYNDLRGYAEKSPGEHHAR